MTVVRRAALWLLSALLLVTGGVAIGFAADAPPWTPERVVTVADVPVTAPGLPTARFADRAPWGPIAAREPGRPVLDRSSSGEAVRDLQARLAQLAWYFGTPTGTYDKATVEAVRGFQHKRAIRVTGVVDSRTMKRLRDMTLEPSRDAMGLHNLPGPMDPRCLTGRVLCVDKSSRTLRWVIDGEARLTVDVRFGSSALPTREGEFSVEYKSRNHVSSLYDTSMPMAMFFSRGQAVHYSPDFAAVGYAGASHGCVNVRDYDAISWLFDQVEVGDKVIVYWS